MRRVRLLRRLLVSLLVLAAATPAAAGAVSERIGSALQNPHNASLVEVAALQLSASPARQLTSPADGVITGWAVRSGDLNELYSLFVLRPRTDGLGGFDVTATAQAPEPVPSPMEQVHRYPAPSLPIAKGDSIALSSPGGPLPVNDEQPAGNQVGSFPGLIAGTSAGAPDPEGSMQELLLQATVEFCRAPDVTRRPIRDAIQLIINADCSPRVLKRKVRKKRRRNKVLSQRTPPGTTGAPGTPVEVVVGKLRKRRR